MGEITHISKMRAMKKPTKFILISVVIVVVVFQATMTSSVELHALQQKQQLQLQQPDYEVKLRQRQLSRSTILSEQQISEESQTQISPSTEKLPILIRVKRRGARGGATGKKSTRDRLDYRNHATSLPSLMSSPFPLFIVTFFVIIACYLFKFE